MRQDLEVRPVHRNGRRYIELADPTTGIRLWLSDLGYSVAFLLDGSALDVVIARAREALHLELTPARLTRFAQRLAGYGLLIGSIASSLVASASPAGAVTLADPPAAAVAAAAVVPPAVPANAAGDGVATLALSPRELDSLRRAARGGPASPPAGAGHLGASTAPAGNVVRLEPRSAGHRRARNVRGRSSVSGDDARTTLLGVAAAAIR